MNKPSNSLVSVPGRHHTRAPKMPTYTVLDTLTDHDRACMFVMVRPASLTHDYFNDILDLWTFAKRGANYGIKLAPLPKP